MNLEVCITLFSFFGSVKLLENLESIFTICYIFCNTIPHYLLQMSINMFEVLVHSRYPIT